MLMVGKIFKEKPSSLELVGDQEFWNLLESYYLNIRVPYKVDDLDTGIKLMYFNISKNTLTEESKDSIEKLNGEIVNGYYWINEAIPLLKKGLEELNNSIV